MAEHLSFEADLWKSANKLRGSIESSQYKHIALGLMFLKYISDSFEERRKELEKRMDDNKDPLYEQDKDEREEILDDPDRYGGVFYIPEKARWTYLQKQVNNKDLPTLLDNAMEIVENSNKKLLNNVLPKVFVRSRIHYESLGELVNVFTKIGFGTTEGKAKDTLGRVYEYFLKMFAMTEGKRGGEFYTPDSIVKILVEILEPYSGRIYDMACGSGGMFVQSTKFIEAHKGKKEDISIYGQESIDTTWRLCKMNLFLRGIEGNIALGDTLLNDQHKSLKANRIIANPPFNLSEWKNDSIDKDPRWKYGLVPNGNANFAWIQHMIHHLDKDGLAGFVLANGSLSVGGDQGKIREEIINDDLVDCIIALPPQLFYTVPIPACLWFLAKNKKEHNGFKKDRRKKVLFIDARKIFTRVSKIQVEFSKDQTNQIANTVRKFRGEIEGYKDIKGFCKIVSLEEINRKDNVLTPGRYVGLPEKEIDKEPFEKKIKRLSLELSKSFNETSNLQNTINNKLKKIKLNGK
ncbi:N-6 DNA methylase [Candidatus Pacearchaeota archaeon]|nr:N-6 DNA methylase [Candidatus Pacearchaeota archaeon]|tara:strand:+ start:542 stop:2101 length:1560 start_codon:yes stop_codon:yes gene_type:complete